MHTLDPGDSNNPGVLLLHGLGANASSWTLQLDILIESGFRPIAPDLPGFGDSAYDGRGWNFKRIASNSRFGFSQAWPRLGVYFSSIVALTGIVYPALR
jgi:pimeloyl-ACP methyl ester carboxylesterase